MDELHEAWQRLYEAARKYNHLGLTAREKALLIEGVNKSSPFPLDDITVLQVIDLADLYDSAIETAWEEFSEKYEPALANLLEDGLHDAEKLALMDLPAPPSFFDSWLVKGSITLVHARPGVGKTPFVMQIANAALQNMGGMGWERGAEQAQRVLYMDGELPLWLLKQRVLASFDPQALRKLTLFSAAYWYNQGHSGLNMGAAAMQQMLNNLISKVQPDIVVLDNRSNFYHGDENDNNEAHALNRYLIGLREKGIAIIMNHHQGKDGGFRGASAIIDPVDNVIGLNRNEENETLIDAQFEKARFGLPQQHQVRLKSNYYVGSGKYVITRA